MYLSCTVNTLQPPLLCILCNCAQSGDILSKFDLSASLHILSSVRFNFDSKHFNISKISAVNYLDITVYRKPTNLIFSMYQKPTSSGTIIHKTSCHPFHPIEHKTATFNYLFNRINKYPLFNANINKELKVYNKLLLRTTFTSQLQ
jgi:hypothetical protein